MNKRLITKKNIVILELIKIGLGNIEIAKLLGRSTKTIENLIRDILRKFNVNNRTELIYRALQEGYIGLKDPVPIEALAAQYQEKGKNSKDYINNEISKFDNINEYKNKKIKGENNE
jgi:DNA-binding CsgD family transcriptional regulator